MTQHSLAATPDTVRIGQFDAEFPPVLTVCSSDTVAVECVSGRIGVLQSSPPIRTRRRATLSYPRAETPTHFSGMGMHENLDQAMKTALREMIAFICSRSNLSREQGYQFCSMAVGFHVTQSVNGEKGVHGMLCNGLLF